MDPLKYIVPGLSLIHICFIPMIEEADRFFFFIRPRRFGKSLTLNMLQHYYDVRTRDKFEAPCGSRSARR